MIQYSLNPVKAKKKAKQYDSVIREALLYYKSGNRLSCKDHLGRGSDTRGGVDKILESKGSGCTSISTKGDYDAEQTKPNCPPTKECQENNSLGSNLCFSDSLQKDELLTALKKYINEYVGDWQEAKCSEISNCGDKKRLLKKYIHEIKKNNFLVLEDLFFFFSMSNDYNDQNDYNDHNDHNDYNDYKGYALSKMFHCLLLVFEKKEEKYVLLVLYTLLQILDENNTNKFFNYIIDALIATLNAHECTLPIGEADENIRLFDHKPMVLTSYLVNENTRYFLFAYFYILVRDASREQFMNHADKIIRVCLTGLFDHCCEINCLMMSFIEEIIEQVEDNYVNYHYIISTCLLKCLCNKYSKVKIKCMNTLVKLILHNSNSKNYKIIEMLIGYKDPNVVPIKSFYDNAYVNINYLCNLYNDRSTKVKFQFYSFIFILLYEFNESNDFVTFLLPYLFSACFDNYKIFRLVSFLYIQLICRRKNFDLDKNMNDEIIYHFHPEWSYKTAFTLPLPLTDYYFPSFCRSSFLVKKNMYILNIATTHPSSTDGNGILLESTHDQINEEDYNSHSGYHSDQIREHQYSVEYHEKLLQNFLHSNQRIMEILRENKITQIKITHNEMNRQCKQLSFTILNAYFKHLYSKKEDESNKLESLENAKIILLLFYFIEENITEHLPHFFTHLLSAFEKKLDEERWQIYMNCLYLVGSYVNPSNYYFFLENYFKNLKENNQKNVTLSCLYILNKICMGTIETYKDIHRRGLTRDGIHSTFVFVLERIIGLFFGVINGPQHVDRYLLVLQIIHTILNSECAYGKLDEKHITQLIILLYIIFNKVKDVRENLIKGKDKICLNRNFYLPVDVLDIHFYINRIKKIKNFEQLDMSQEQININVGSEILYKIFTLSDDNLNQKTSILQILPDDFLYNSHYVYFLIQYIIKRQTFFYDKSLSIFLCKIMIKLFNLNQNKKNIIKVVLYNEELALYDIHQESRDKYTKQVKHVFLEYACTIFLLFIFRSVNIYETFGNVVETCKVVLHLLTEVKNPYSFLFFVKRTSLITKLCDILECREARSIFFCKHVLNDLQINYEKYMNNDGDIKYLDHINIGKKIGLRKQVNTEVDILFYFVSTCVYLIYYKSLDCLSVLLKDSAEEIGHLKVHEAFRTLFDGTEKRVLEILKIKEQGSYTMSNLYKKTIENMLLEKNNFSELFLLRQKILNSPDYNDLILNTHIYFRYTFALLQRVHMFLLNPVILHYFYEVNHGHFPSSTDVNLISGHKSDNMPPKNPPSDSDKIEQGSHSNKDNNQNQEEKNFINEMVSFLQKEEIHNIEGIKYDHTNLENYFKSHDFVFLILEQGVYHIPFRVLEKNSLIILLYSSLLFFVDDFFQIEVVENSGESSFLSSISVGLSKDFFLNPLQISEDHLIGLFNLLILVCLENEDLVSGALIKMNYKENAERTANFHMDIFCNIINNVIFNYEKKNMVKESLCSCLSFLLSVLSANYGDVLENLKVTYTRTKHVKRLDVCNNIINTFL
ncbi:conserved Plasmodium protein, unknown function [Plasmodium knowlesi strain H]|uniref:Uncharacterized protein n=3 Tax=Plasmodium knowlesi TaxID=5850 RepID=A0A5K1UVG2_PLAKH|nr:conserved Plasmodium protein, unknown function [Plasmodium knowlesi strain H]OTN67053.1 Uncharacterized protein PKNOH_S07449700 [Plasmodium knowlesi]CAA9988624.1 conserved Plasmodium protein, unknown function [Plasmodium knowlesi strain H]SBO21467.1 conserved Plasmodium protein, unknown function [Plasmodium knowlesi strain H]SBO21898.1 conserved Plasmodium protein, unknown function [Plasmodium knowlesi strain H]VVS78098.1 conserved Plasmodium protein, unknown function [Plasmodium knowlesi s|eukprot:XP_002259600.1 hypothetical protein, conserved in Plasmodium species [Plasmodium knowlesi strain H]